MQSEHISNLHPGWVVAGWVVAVAVAAVVFLTLVGTGLLPPGGPEYVGSAVAVVVGFFAGGFFVGLRWSDAPVLHGVAITLLSLLIWFVGLLIAPATLGGAATRGDAALILGAIILQLVAGVAGALTGRSLVLRGRTPDATLIPPEA